MQGLSCFWTILSALPYTCLVLLALFCFACFLGVNRFLVGIIFILVKYLSLLLGYYIVPYHIIPISHHISGKHLLLCLSVLMSKRNAMHPFICPFHLSIFRFYSLFLFSLLSYCYLYGTKLVKNDIFYENGLLLFHSSCLISNGFS